MNQVASVLNILDDELIRNVGDYILRLVSRSSYFDFCTKSGCMFLAWRGILSISVHLFICFLGALK